MSDTRTGCNAEGVFTLEGCDVPTAPRWTRELTAEEKALEAEVVRNFRRDVDNKTLLADLASALRGTRRGGGQ
jgi:hypothetical protein